MLMLQRKVREQRVRAAVSEEHDYVLLRVSIHKAHALLNRELIGRDPKSDPYCELTLHAVGRTEARVVCTAPCAARPRRSPT